MIDFVEYFLEFESDGGGEASCDCVLVAIRLAAHHLLQEMPVRDMVSLRVLRLVFVNVRIIVNF